MYKTVNATVLKRDRTVFLLEVPSSKRDRSSLKWDRSDLK
jgi:hypothetical protein